eukprot:gnl/MRDRNA2_/MRDRNA2_92015_c0_seq1.p1 gnl/MRDRNA2_/MRDRNA2_92015_c0~~gnl/MRDRNA2_/MRDRNA2_92015_c0_seq1.p1  ORF type:complete len:401 (+),score=67.28 gnl/MRDRNA2_/MRDRNA2_92015_c0_seq1:112-1314(+)
MGAVCGKDGCFAGVAQGRGKAKDLSGVQNKAVVLRNVMDMGLDAYPMPEAKDDDCIIEMKAVGICGSDVHYWQHGKIGNFVCKGPMVIGHESSGVVVQCGKCVKGLSPGDRVALEPGVPCGVCEQCNSGKYNLCPDIRFFATPPIHGSLQRYVAHPAKFCFKLPDHVSMEEGAMCEPLSVGVYACEQKAKVKPGCKLAVFGAGPIGTICSMVAHGMGAGKVILCDVVDARLEFCKSCVPIETLNTMGMNSQQVADKIKQLAGGPVDGSIDCCGVESAIQAGIYATKNGGVVTLVGMGRDLATVPLLDASCREVELQGVFRYRNTYPKCIELLANKKVNVAPLITHKYVFNNESIMDAFKCCHLGKSPDGRSSIKCMITIDDAEAEKAEVRTACAQNKKLF